MSREVFTGPIPGRIVHGHPAKSQTKTDQNTRQPVLRNGAPIEQWVFGVAFAKQVFEQYIYPHMHAEMLTVYPNGAPPAFSWKYKDGDGVDRQGKPYSEREGYAGCYVLTISTEAFAPPLYRDVNGVWVQMAGEEIKCGDFVACVLDLKANVPTNASHTPGLYVNPKAVIFAGYGTEIVRRASFDPTTLGQVQFQQVAGMSATPLVPMGAGGVPGVAPGVMPQMQQPMMQPAMQPQVQQPMVQQPVMAQPVQQPMVQQPVMAQPVQQQPMMQPQMQPGLPAPAHDFVQNAGQPMMQPVAQPQMQPMAQPAMQPMMQPAMQPVGMMPGQVAMPGR